MYPKIYIYTYNIGKYHKLYFCNSKNGHLTIINFGKQQEHPSLLTFQITLCIAKLVLSLLKTQKGNLNKKEKCRLCRPPSVIFQLIFDLKKSQMANKSTKTSKHRFCSFLDLLSFFFSFFPPPDKKHF